MATKEEVDKMRETQQKLTEEDKTFSEQLAKMDEEFTTKNHLTREDFNTFYSEGVKNFRLDFGTVCERGEAEVVESLKVGKDKKRVVGEYLSCVEFTRQKAAQRAQQAD